MDILGKFKKTVTDTSKIVAQKAKDVAEVTKLTGQISSEEAKIKEAYLAIGKRYFEENIGEVSDVYINNFTIINEAKARICELQEQIKTISGIFACPNCGADVTLDSAFCSACGAKIEAPEPKSDVVVPKKSDTAEPVKEEETTSSTEEEEKTEEPE